MIFTTSWFLVFALGAIGIFWLIPWAKGRLGWLAGVCAIFHWNFAGPAGVWPILVLMALTYFAGRSEKKWACLLAIVACVAALCLYKYFRFFVGSFVSPLDAGTGKYLLHQARRDLPAAPPLAISFFVFEFVHYLYEVRRGGEPIRNPLRFFLFAIFFPSLVAGPIKRYTQFLPQLGHAIRERLPGLLLAEGARRMALGYFKKVVIADNLTLYIEATQPHFSDVGLGERWVVLAAIAARILFDFSGYSDIAIGCAEMLGIRLPENFNWPYAAKSLQEFWQRWHISLSYWIRDYVYIPLGGSRHGAPRRALNALVAFSLCGLWHGPAWHFVLWGIFHGAGLAVGTVYRKLPGAKGLTRIFEKEPYVALVVTQLYVWMGWLIFFYPENEAWKMARELFGA